MPAILLVTELIAFGCARTVQCDPKLYYPRIPVLEKVAASAPGRIIGYACFPPIIPRMCGLNDVRGYDGVDPSRMVALVRMAADPRSLLPDYASTQLMAPQAGLTPEGDVRIAPVLDMLGVRYVIFRSQPAEGARFAFQGEDYWVMTNSAALPRVFVPQRVETVTDSYEQLGKMQALEFNPREVAYVETPVNFAGTSRGAAEIVIEIPTRVTVSVRMETPGLVVLADSWDKGWQAYVNGKPVTILRTNHAVRGVAVPAGESKIEFRYEPASFALGLKLSGVAALVLLGWVGFGVMKKPARQE